MREAPSLQFTLSDTIYTMIFLDPDTVYINLQRVSASVTPQGTIIAHSDIGHWAIPPVLIRH